MATKTITIDMEAYNRLKSIKQNGESFSQTIKRVVRKPIDFEKWMAELEKNPMSDEALDAVDRIVAERRGGSHRSRRRGAA